VRLVTGSRLSPAADARVTVLDKWRLVETIVAQNRLGLSELRCLVLLLSLVNADSGEAWPSYDGIARALGCSSRRAKQIVHELARKGEIEVRRGGGRRRPNRYRPRWKTVQSKTPFLDLIRRANGEGSLHCSKTKKGEKGLHPLEAKNGEGRVQNSEETLHPNTETLNTSPQRGDGGGARGEPPRRHGAVSGDSDTRARTREDAPPAPEVDLNAGRSAAGWSGSAGPRSRPADRPRQQSSTGTGSRNR
jgi:Helix-turn-helix domain